MPVQSSASGGLPDSVLPAAAVSRRNLLKTTACATAAGAIGAGAAGCVSAAPAAMRSEQGPDGERIDVRLRVNDQPKTLTLDPRTTLLDALREHLHLTGSKKGCDHGQCGACTVLVNGTRINACLTLAAMHDGDEVTTIEGLARGDQLHPLQQAFIDHDGFQCGYCTPGQICSAVGVLDEARRGMPSQVTAPGTAVLLDAREIRERMSGNICRCSAYPNIVAAVAEVAANGGRA